METLGKIALVIFCAWAGLMILVGMIWTTTDMWQEFMAWLRRMAWRHDFNKNCREWKRDHPDDPLNPKNH